MKLDDRIENDSMIYNPFTSNVADFWNYLSKNGYFSDALCDFSDLSCCEYGEFDDYASDSGVPYCIKFEDGSKEWRAFFIPEENLKNYKKYVPFTIEEFENKHYFDIVVFRKKKGNVELHSRYNGYTYSRERGFDVLLGCEYFSFEELFNNYELRDSDGNWKPFGVEE